MLVLYVYSLVVIGFGGGKKRPPYDTVARKVIKRNDGRVCIVASCVRGPLSRKGFLAVCNAKQG